MSYLARLTLQLAAGTQALPREMLARQTAWLCAAQRPDGGFAGRSGQSDVYYTSFGLRALLLVGALDEARARAAGGFLASWLKEKIAARSGAHSATPSQPSTGQPATRSQPNADRPEGPSQPSTEHPTLHISMPELASLVLSAATIEAVLGPETELGRAEPAGPDLSAIGSARLAALRRQDGGFAGTDRSRASGTYHTFIGLLCCRQLDLPLDRPGAIIELVRSRQRPDGGFAESASARLSGTNPTAAAVAVLRALEALETSVAQRAAGFLAAMQTPEGGWRAHGRIPLADLLSTFSALVAIRDLEALDSVDTEAAARFAGALERVDGGFRGVAIEEAVDVEYTFYGLGSLALLNADTLPDENAAR